MSAEIESLINGYHLFRKKYFSKDNKHYERLVKYGQSPKFLVVACSDSRVDPALLLSCEPGDLFVVRNVANLIPPYEIDSGYHSTSAALEFGVCSLGIKNILVLGHTQCGGIANILETKKQPALKESFIAKWMELANMACSDAINSCNYLSKEEQVDQCGRYAMMGSLRNLLTFSWILDRVNSSALEIHLWNFDLRKGFLEVYNKEQDKFMHLK